VSTRRIMDRAIWLGLIKISLVALPAVAPQARPRAATTPVEVVRDGSFELGAPNEAWEEGFREGQLALTEAYCAITGPVDNSTLF
jgi:hypothetical protein